MKSPQHTENNENFYTRGTQIYSWKNIPTINFGNKLLSLPLINKNIVFSDRSPVNINKKSLEGFKPIEDIKPRTKLETNNNNKSLKIKFLSLEKNKSKDNILFLMNKMNKKNRFIKFRNNLMNKDIFNDTSKKKNLILSKKYFTELKENKNINNKKKNLLVFSKTPKRIKQILINDNFSFNTLSSNFESKENKNLNTENINYPSVRTEIEKKERNNHKLRIHYIFFDWIMKNIITETFNNKEEINRSFDLSIKRNLSTKKIKNKNNKKIKSADISRNNNLKIKEAFIFDKNDKDTYYKNKLKNKLLDLFDYFKIINKDNIDENYINTKTFENILNILPTKINLNKNYIKKEYTNNKTNNESSESESDSEIIKKNKKEILSLKKGNRFLSKFIHKLLNNNYDNYKSNEIIDINENKDNLKDKSFLYKRFIESKKNEENEKEKHKINNKVNKSLKLSKKLNISILNDKIKLYENNINKSKDNYNIFAYRNRKAINNNICLTSVKKKNKMERNDNKKHFNIVMITSPEQIIQEKKTIYENNNPEKKEINDDLKNLNKNYVKSKNNTMFYQIINQIKTNSINNNGEEVLHNSSSEKNLNYNNNSHKNNYKNYSQDKIKDNNYNKDTNKNYNKDKNLKENLITPQKTKSNNKQIINKMNDKIITDMIIIISMMIKKIIIFIIKKYQNNKIKIKLKKIRKLLNI